jgi:hypothetical protein
MRLFGDFVLRRVKLSVSNCNTAHLTKFKQTYLIIRVYVGFVLLDLQFDMYVL